MSIRRTEGDRVDILVVDDCSPNQTLVEGAIRDFEASPSFLHCEWDLRPTNEGFSRTVNVGLQRALDEGRDAILCNADIEFIGPWLDYMLNRSGVYVPDKPAGIVGALLLYNNGLIQHGGVYLSLLTRAFDHLYKYAPMNLPDAHVARTCPVTGALQFIRHSTLVEIGLYDEEFRMGFEDVDYCLRTMLGGIDCVYEPMVQAYHHESMFRGRGRGNEKLDAWHAASQRRIIDKYVGVPLQALVPQW